MYRKGQVMGIDYDAEIESFEWDIPETYAVTSVVDSVISLEEIPAAHERFSNGEGFGKIIVRP